MEERHGNVLTARDRAGIIRNGIIERLILLRLGSEEIGLLIAVIDIILGRLGRRDDGPLRNSEIECLRRDTVALLVPTIIRRIFQGDGDGLTARNGALVGALGHRVIGLLRVERGESIGLLCSVVGVGIPRGNRHRHAKATYLEVVVLVIRVRLVLAPIAVLGIDESASDGLRADERTGKIIARHVISGVAHAGEMIGLRLVIIEIGDGRRLRDRDGALQYLEGIRFVSARSALRSLPEAIDVVILLQRNGDGLIAVPLARNARDDVVIGDVAVSCESIGLLRLIEIIVALVLGGRRDLAQRDATVHDIECGVP